MGDGLAASPADPRKGRDGEVDGRVTVAGRRKERSVGVVCGRLRLLATDGRSVERRGDADRETEGRDRTALCAERADRNSPRVADERRGESPRRRKDVWGREGADCARRAEWPERPENGAERGLAERTAGRLVRGVERRADDREPDALRPRTALRPLPESAMAVTVGKAMSRQKTAAVSRRPRVEII